MALHAGTRIGPYEVIGQIGAGGMGEVYRATDINLTRQVAVKVLPDTFANDPERLARFEREAKTLASLNHPNIAQIYGFERADGIRALVMELVEGPTLADRIAQGPVSVDEALPIAKQIAEALEAAHEQGIIHRDLKPANIKVRSDGTVKVLDFGLAKALEPANGVSPNMSQSPTITSPAMMTGVGMLLGTAAYMSPEQARGKPVDRRSDIWAFGCLLFEMLAGRRAFEGESVSDTLAAVLRSEPDWSALPVSTPSSIRRLLERCLAKDRSVRLDSAAAARLDIVDARGKASDSHLVADPGIRGPRVPLIVAASVLATGILVGSAVWWVIRPDAPLIARLEMQVPGAQPLNGNRSFAVTPDGTRFVYRADNQLFVRPLDQSEATLLPGATVPNSLCISPDGQWVGFGDVYGLKKMAISGGAAVTLAMVDAPFRGATWGPDDTIVFATGSPKSGLQRVSAAGGDVTTLTTPDAGRGEADHVWPRFLPGGRAVLYTITAATDQPAGLIDASEQSQIAVLDLESGAQTVLVRGGTDAQYVPTGHLIYRVGTALHAVTFDLGRLQIVGAAVPVVHDVAIGTFGATPAVVSMTGTLVYVRGGAAALPGRRTLVWVDRNGREEPIAAPARPYLYPRLSPDGTRIAVSSNDEEYDLWAWDLIRGTLSRLTFDPAADLTPMWTPDGRGIVFSSTREGGQFNLFVQPSDGTGKAERLSESVDQQATSGITPDGAGVLFHEGSQQRDINLLRFIAPRRVEALVATRFDERGGIVSPDGRWLAYESNSSGRHEIYVRPFPHGDGQWQVSHPTAGGVQPLWSHDGRELFYIAPDGSVMAVEAEASANRWNPGVPRPVVPPGYFTGASSPYVTRQYDVSADNQRFVMLKGAADQTSTQRLAVVLNWYEELKRLVPTN